MKMNLILTTLLLAMFLAISLNSCIFIPGGFPAIGPRPEVTGFTNMATWEYEFADFTNINASSAFTVNVSQSDSYSISITANENLLEYLNVYQRGKTLYLGMKSANYRNVRYEANITMPSLLNFELSGASKGNIGGFGSTNPLKLRLSGASRISGSIKAGDCNFNLSGASTVELAGTGNDADINASGASKVELADFPISNAAVTLSGASRATLNLDGQLDANLSGYSHIEYIAEPTLGSIKTSGSSTVSKK
jgi:hypothetical protein